MAWSTRELAALASTTVRAVRHYQPPPRLVGPGRHRAKEIERGNWGAGAVNTAVTRTAAAIAASTAVTVSVISTTSTELDRPPGLTMPQRHGVPWSSPPARRHRAGSRAPTSPLPSA